MPTYSSGDGRIAAVGEGLPAAGAETLDCTGLVVTAGFVDAHVHIESSMVLPAAFGEAVLPHGTTCVIADPHEVVNVAGAEGLRSFLDEAAAAPVGIFTAVPSSVPATMLDTNGAGEFLADAMREFAERPDVAGLGEVMCFYDVAERRPEIMEKIALFRDKTIDGPYGRACRPTCWTPTSGPVSGTTTSVPTLQACWSATGRE